MGRPRLIRLGLAITVGLALAACGTTVPGAGGTGSGGDGLTAPSNGGPERTPAPGQSQGSTAQLPATGADLPGTAGASAGLQGGLPTGSTSLGPASSTTKLPPIEIGTYYLDGGSGALAAAGFAGLVIPDNRPLFDAMVKHLNAHGGLGGRQIKPVEFKYSAGGSPQGQDAAACAFFTQDHHAYLVVGGISSGAGELGPCLTKHGVPLIGANNGGDERYFAANHRYIYEPGQANFTLGLSTLVRDLHANRFFMGSVKIGLVQYEGAVFDHAVEDGLKPSLARLGLKLTDSVKMTGTDNGSIASASAGAVLKFSAEGINRVVFMAPGGAAATYFMNAASSQDYRPRYGIWSADSPYVLAITAAKDQLANSMGVGYQPGLDVSSSQDPTDKTPEARACLAFWDSVGQTDRSGLNSPLKRAMCDGFATLQRAVSAGPTTLTSTAALEAGYDAIGSSFRPASTFAMRFGPGGHDAANGYRRLVYEVGCSCFVYTGTTRALR